MAEFDLTRYDIRSDAIVDHVPTTGFDEDELTDEEEILVECEYLEQEEHDYIVMNTDRCQKQGIDNEDLLAIWYLELQVALKDKMLRLRQQAARAQNTLKNRLKALGYKYQARVEERVRQKIEEQHATGDRRSCIDFPNARVSFSNRMDKVKVYDVSKVKDWFEAQSPEVRAELQSCWQLKLRATAPIIQYLRKNYDNVDGNIVDRETGEIIEIPGIRWEPGEKNALFSHRVDLGGVDLPILVED